MPSRDIDYRHKLPHIHPNGYPLFITFRLANSLPLDALFNLERKHERELRSIPMEERDNIEEKHFIYFDEVLGRSQNGPRWLQNQNIAQMIMEEIKSLDGNRYNLIACCIMPNHVHLLIESLIDKSAAPSGRSSKYPVADTLRLLKGRTARKSNLELGRSGSFWQHESYDHFIRDAAELERTIHYILNNPVRAGLAKEWKDWKYTYISPEFGEW